MTKIDRLSISMLQSLFVVLFFLEIIWHLNASSYTTRPFLGIHHGEQAIVYNVSTSFAIVLKFYETNCLLSKATNERFLKILFSSKWWFKNTIPR